MNQPYDNEKKIALFRNDKGDNPKRPDYRGTLTLNGVEYKASLWIRQDKKGNDYLNGSIEVKEDRTPQGNRAPAPSRPTPAPEPAKFTPGGGHTGGEDMPDVPFAPFKH
jgi:hypothetical protein